MSKSSARMLALAVAMALLLTRLRRLLVSPGDSVRETLPAPVSNSPAAPVGDDQMLNSFYAWLSYPNADGTAYAPVSRLFTDTSLNDEAFAALQALLEGGASSVRSPAPEGTRLVSVEIASRIATVNLIPGRMLSDDEKATIAACVSATLFNLTELSAVNVLLAGRPLTLYSLPVGALRESDVTSISDLKEHLQRDGAAARSARRVLPGRGRTACGAHPALPVRRFRQRRRSAAYPAGQRAGQTGLLPAIAAREGLLTSPCTLSAADNNRLVLDIPFSAAVYDALEESDVSRWQFLASVVLTLTTYIDELDGIRISFDGKPVKSVPLPDGGSLSFENNLLTRRGLQRKHRRNRDAVFRGRKRSPVSGIPRAPRGRRDLHPRPAGASDGSSPDGRPCVRHSGWYHALRPAGRRSSKQHGADQPVPKRLRAVSAAYAGGRSPLRIRHREHACMHEQRKRRALLRGRSDGRHPLRLHLHKKLPAAQPWPLRRPHAGRRVRNP